MKANAVRLHSHIMRFACVFAFAYRCGRGSTRITLWMLTHVCIVTWNRQFVNCCVKVPLSLLIHLANNKCECFADWIRLSQLGIKLITKQCVYWDTRQKWNFFKHSCAWECQNLHILTSMWNCFWNFLKFFQKLPSANIFINGTNLSKLVKFLKIVFDTYLNFIKLSNISKILRKASTEF